MKLVEKADPKNGKFYYVYMPHNTAKKTVYFLGPYKGQFFHFRTFIKRMTRRGYRVVYLQPCEEVLSHHHPKWLGESIEQAVTFIKNDMKQYPENSTSLIGVSLGSYLNLNILLQIPFKKCIAVAGGAPLVGVFRAKFLFRSARNELTKNGKDIKSVTNQWQPYDETFKESKLKHLNIMLINSNNDRLLGPENFSLFVRLLKKTGAKVVNSQGGYLPHVVQALSINFRIRQIIRFLNAD